ncbi:MAG: methyltransferase domain-containing protein [Janthinobacterium lividum]
MKSLNPEWSPREFHRHLAVLGSITEGSTVLDLGCGSGLTLPYLLAAAGASGTVLALDRAGSGLEEVRKRHPSEIARGHLRLIEADIANGIPVPDGSLDSVICQNVIECVSDRASLLLEITRVLKPAGTVVIGHYDFDGVILASHDRELTRRLVHGYADHVQQWQDASDGQMGRLLPGLAASGPFAKVATETVLFVDLALSPESYASIHLEGMVALSPRLGVSVQQAQAWLIDLQRRSERGAFYYALPWTYFTARTI